MGSTSPSSSTSLLFFAALVTTPMAAPARRQAEWMEIRAASSSDDMKLAVNKVCCAFLFQVYYYKNISATNLRL
jgi:hypothetical protein